ncbi:MAG: type II toxin-antitoxin system RelE/ParE family toxin [Rubrobacter sp.]|nr:type II toxin-antitoxin system RelE/ParE family toxin [Rubrobacter sp.]MDQ3375270.1 type II toxin-antitoxin system RelE/ParE family toxin [Actinomycetota bacterium]
MAYTVEIPRKVQKQVARLTDSVRDRRDRKARALAANPRPQGCRKLSGREEWRIRVGNYRVVYEIQDDRSKVLILEIRHRQRDYK